jgi:uncharacterized membrane protein
VINSLARHHELERLLGRVLDQGTWIASGIVAIGWILAALGWRTMGVINGGVALFLLLPVLRVLIMLVVFIRERDYRFSAITALVLAVIVLGAFLGTRMS